MGGGSGGSGVSGPPVIRVEELMAALTLEELRQSADGYWSRLSGFDYHHAKPFASVDEVSVLLAHFSAMLAVLELSPGMSVLDFGAGSCWTSRFLTQLGMAVTAVDISPHALEVGKALYARMAVVGPHPPPRFEVFDGLRLPVEDESVDRIACMDAFHHVHNPDVVLAEMARVLRPGGRAVLAEPGPGHSLSPQSQSEMRNFRVVERDIVLREIEVSAREAGFSTVWSGLYSPQPVLLPAASFDGVLVDAAQTGPMLAGAAGVFHANHRLVVLVRAGESRPDSRRRVGVAGALAVREVVRDAKVWLEVDAVNTGGAWWLGHAAPTGAVNVGAHLIGADGAMKDFDFLRIPLTAPGALEGFGPGERTTVSIPRPTLPSTGDRLVFDLVAEGVCWFADIGATPLTWG